MTILEAPEITVEVGGKPLAAPASAKPCEHRQFGSSVVVAEVSDVHGALERREARLRLRCMECGTPCAVETSGRPPADGGPGVVLTFRPLDEAPAQVLSPASLGGPHAG